MGVAQAVLHDPSQGLLETFPTFHATYRTGDANRSTPTVMSHDMNPAYEFCVASR
jgi:hypothetical protein